MGKEMISNGRFLIIKVKRRNYMMVSTAGPGFVQVGYLGTDLG